MTHTFDIRFARSSGLASFLEAPANAFRWKGGGSLSIDAQGVSIAVKRGFLSLFASKQMRRIDAADLTDVYREREALRLEFTAAGARHWVMPLWARDRDTAAEIVKLLPTNRTVEIDEALPISARSFRLDGRIVSVLLVTLTAIALGVAALTRILAPPPSPVIAMPVTQAPGPKATVEAVAAPDKIVRVPVVAPGALTLPFPLPADPAYVLPDSMTQIVIAPRIISQVELPEVTVLRVPVTDGVVPIVPGEPAYEAAVAQLNFFMQESNRLQGEYLYGRTPMSAIEAQWWSLSERIYNSADIENPALRPLIDAELAASQNWRGALSLYREATSIRNNDLIDAARDQIERANRLTDRVRLYVY